MKLLILNGPNLNFLGIREVEIYSTMTYQELCDKINNYANSINIDVSIHQTNYEGTIIDLLQNAHFDDTIDGIILNAGAYTHTSYAIMDAIKAIQKPVIEVHLTNPEKEKILDTSPLLKTCVLKLLKERGIKAMKKPLIIL